MGRSYSISLVTKSRIGASQFLSRRLCGSGAGDEVPSGQSRCFLPQRTQRKAEKSRDYSGLKAAHYIRQAAGMHARIAQIVGNTYNLAAIGELLSILIRTLQLRAEVESTPSALFFGKRNCGGKKEM